MKRRGVVLGREDHEAAEDEDLGRENGREDPGEEVGH